MERLVTEGEGRVSVDLGDLRRVEVALVAGEVTVAATPGPTRVEVEWLSGPPLKLVETDGVLMVSHETRCLPTQRPRALVVVQCQPSTDLRTSTVTAPTVVAGVAGDVSATTVSGTVTLGYVGGNVRVRTVSGAVEMEGVSGRLAVESVSGPVDLAGGRLSELNASSASGDLSLDLDLLPSGSYRCVTVSGDVGIRVPAESVADVEAVSLSGQVDLAGRSTGRGFRPRRATIGQQVTGTEPTRERARLFLRTVSGRVAVVTRGGARPESATEVMA